MIIFGNFSVNVPWDINQVKVMLKSQPDRPGDVKVILKSQPDRPGLGRPSPS
jgi:hypothetical protein